MRSGIASRLRRLQRKLLRASPVGTRRRRLVLVGSRAAEALFTEGWRGLLHNVAVLHSSGWKLPEGAAIERWSSLSNLRYGEWVNKCAPRPVDLQRMQRVLPRLVYQPLISVIVPTYNTSPELLAELVRSLEEQVYPRWELCFADDGSREPSTVAALRQYQSQSKIRVDFLERNSGISAASNAALGLSAGDYVALVDHDDELKANALFEVVSYLNAHPEADLVYTDEDKKAPSGKLVDPFFKPDWSPDLLMSINYIGHLTVLRRTLVEELGGFRSEYDGSQDYDLYLRATEIASHVGHVPLPLYTWRKISGSVAHDQAAKPYAYSAAKAALRAALRRRGVDATVEDGLFVGSYRVRHRLRNSPRIDIVIPTRDRRDLLEPCVTSIREKSTYEHYRILIIDNGTTDAETVDYLEDIDTPVLPFEGNFNFAAMMNQAARESTAEVLVFLNNDTRIISPGWLEAMLEHALRPQIGPVGARLLHSDGRVQHEGIVVDLKTGPVNVDYKGYFRLGECVRNCSAVTAACMMIRSELFHELEGFDEAFPVAFNDVDFCLRAAEKGYLTVYTPFALLYHDEGSTRGSGNPVEHLDLFRRRWRAYESGDPYHNPHLALE